MIEMTNAYKFLSENLKGGDQLGGPRRRWKSGISVGLREIRGKA
jgi:hypothetical protein